MALSPHGPTPLCERCDACLSQDAQGLCYLEPFARESVRPLYNSMERKYLHYSCYYHLRNARISLYIGKENQEQQAV